MERIHGLNQNHTPIQFGAPAGGHRRALLVELLHPLNDAWRCLHGVPFEKLPEFRDCAVAVRLSDGADDASGP